MYKFKCYRQLQFLFPNSICMHIYTITILPGPFWVSSMPSLPHPNAKSTTPTAKYTSCHCQVYHMLLSSLPYPTDIVYLTFLPSLPHLTAKCTSPHCQVYLTLLPSLRHLTAKSTSPHRHVYITSLPNLPQLTAKSSSLHHQVYLISLPSLHHLTVKSRSLHCHDHDNGV